MSETESEPVNVFFFGCVLLAGPSKLTVIAQVCSGLRVLGQLFVWEKYNPLILMPKTLKVDAPELVRIAFWGGVQPPPTRRAAQTKVMLLGVSVVVEFAGFTFVAFAAGVSGLREE